jgi:Tfp pilus assembly protein FimT
MIEIITALVVLGILVAISAPKLNGMITRDRTRAAVDQLAADVAYTRLLAVRNGVPSTLRFTSTGYRVTVETATQRVAKRVDLRSEYGVSFAQRPAGDTLSFNPRGLMSSTNAKIKVSRESRVDSLVVTPLGGVLRGY